MSGLVYHFTLFAVLLLLGYSECLVTITATPPRLDLGLTSSLNIRCSYDAQEGQKLTAIISLSLSRESNGSSFEEVASVNIFLGNQVKIFTSEDVTGTGSVNTMGESYLDLDWRFPTEQTAGIYKCSVQGIDNVGHNVVLDNSTEVFFSTPDQSILLHKIQEMDVMLRQLQNTVNELKTQNGSGGNFNSNVSSLERCCQQNSQKINDLEAYDQFMEANHKGLLEALKPVLIKASLNNIYWISQNTFDDVHSAEVLCNAYNGHLAEINTSQEYDVIKSFLLKNYSDVYYTYVGATKIGDQWVYRDSGTPVSFFAWAQNEPKPGNSTNCMFLEGVLSWTMTSYSCASKNPIYALCEIR